MNYFYQGVEVSKNEMCLIEFLMTGSDCWVDAYYFNTNRKKPRKINANDLQKHKSWFNSTLKKLHKKGIMKRIPFVIFSKNSLIYLWANPLKQNANNFKEFILQSDVKPKTSPII